MQTAIAACFVALTAVAFAQTPSSEQPAPVKELAAEIAKANTDTERENLLERAEPEWLTNQSLRKELAAIEYKLKLEGDYRRAESIDRLLIRLAATQADEEGVAAGKVQLAGAMREFGEEAEAMTLAQEALGYYEKHPSDGKGLLRAHQWLGVLHMYRSDFRRGLAHLEEALEIGQKTGFREGVIPVLNSIGNLHRAQEQPERALRVFEEARAVVGDDGAWNMAFIFNNIGQCYEAMDEIERAVDYIGRAKAIAEKVKFRPRVATSLAVLGNLHLRRRQLEEAEQSYRESLSLSVELRDVASEARALLGLAEVARERENLEEALAPAQRSAELYRSLGQRAELAAALTTAGRCYRGLGRPEEARAAFNEAIAETERIRGQVAGGVMEAEAFFANKLAPYHEMVAMFAADGGAAEALAISERASARVLLDILARGQRNFEQTLSAGEREEQGRLGRRVADLNHQLKQARAAQPLEEKRIAQLLRELAQARDERENFAARLDAARPVGRQAPAQMASLDEIGGLVADGKTALLKFVVGDKQTLVFVVRKVAQASSLRGAENGKLSAGAAFGKEGEPDIRVFPVPLTRDALTKAVRDFRTKLAARALDWKKPSAELFEALLASSEPAWKDAARLVIVPDGPLWELAFQALRRGERSLLEDHAINYAPSLSFLARSRSTPETPQSSRLLAVGNPSLGADRGPRENASRTAGLMSEEWKPLPATEKQVAELASVYPREGSRTLVGTAASEQAVKAAAGKCDVLHFATHGVLNDAAPLSSYLLLSQEGLSPEEDGMLEGWELMRMNLHARLAVLSACETGRGRISPGEGIVGLSWAMLLAGCPATVVSQWKVESASNTELMVGFHRRLRDGAAPAEALREASLALAQSATSRHPFYWAAFVMVGAL